LGGSACPPKPELENLDPVTAQVFQTMGKVMHLNRLVMQRTMALRGVQYPEVFALSWLSTRDGISQRELTECLHLSRPRVSMILRALEKDGCIRREIDEPDRRLARVFLTAEGRRREKEHRDILGRYVERTIGALPEADRRKLGELLEQLAGHLHAVLRPAQESKPFQGEAEAQ
jgi:DNA-binding MarR family transcriptional regulator